MIKKEISLKTWIILGVVVAILLSVVICVISNYNLFIKLDQEVNGKWSEVENQYQRQADLIPNLISTLSNAVKVETQFITEITEARTNWQESNTQYDKDSAGVQMNNGIAKLIATMENYPVLQANKQYVALTDELSGTQNRITVARGRYIEAIQSYNTAIKTFPANLISKLFGFGEKKYYQTDSLTTPTIGTGILP